MRDEFNEKAKGRHGLPKKHQVMLTAAERRRLMKMLKDDASPWRQRRATILLALDEGDRATESSKSYRTIGEQVGVSYGAVYIVAKLYVEGGITAVVERGNHNRMTAAEEAQLKQIIERTVQEFRRVSINQLAEEIGRAHVTVRHAIERLAERGEIDPGNFLK
jgi:DNA-binding transcriptional ArsR family regulator